MLFDDMPDERGILTIRMEAHDLEDPIGMRFGHECHELAFVGDEQGIQTEHLASSRYFWSDRNAGLLELNANSRGLCQLVEHGTQAAARGIAQAMDVGGFLEHGGNQAM